jgi:hypothetical protein
MKKQTQQEKEEEIRRVDPTTLQPILTVYGERLYIKKGAWKNRRSLPGRLLPIYHADGRGMVEASTIDGKTYYMHIMLHPANIDRTLLADSYYVVGERVLVNKRIGIVREVLPGANYKVTFGYKEITILHVDELLRADPENDTEGQSFKGKD